MISWYHEISLIVHGLWDNKSKKAGMERWYEKYKVWDIMEGKRIEGIS